MTLATLSEILMAAMIFVLTGAIVVLWHQVDRLRDDAAADIEDLQSTIDILDTRVSNIAGNIEHTPVTRAGL